MSSSSDEGSGTRASRPFRYDSHNPFRWANGSVAESRMTGTRQAPSHSRTRKR